MINKIEIIQENYEKILELAKISNSKTDLCKRLGWKKNSSKLRHLTELLLSNNFNNNLFLRSLPKKYSSIFNNKDNLVLIVNGSNSYTEVLKGFNLNLTGSNLKTLKKYLNLFKIEITHFNPQKRYLAKEDRRKYHNDEIFVINSPVDTTSAKRRILLDKLIDYKCKCGNEGEWQGHKITLQLEHKNGDNRDHRLNNLEFLCPNCHSITPTWGNKNTLSNKRSELVKKQDKKLKIKANLKVIRNRKLENNQEKILGNIINYSNLGEILKEYDLDTCSKNYHALRNMLEANKTSLVVDFLKKANKKVQYPNLEILKEEVLKKGYEQVGRELNCSGNAIKYYLKKNK